VKAEDRRGPCDRARQRITEENVIRINRRLEESVMSLMTVHNDNGTLSGVKAARAETACVSVICLLASAPLFVAIGLMIWGG